MSLKQSIVVVNEFSERVGKSGGSRGATPGSYVERYMARQGAVEDLTPVRLLDADDYVVRYMAREDATEAAGDVAELREGMRAAQKDAGVAFGPGNLSMSHERVHAASQAIQRAFEEGKTVMKTVVSFDHEYLRETGIIDEDFEATRRGDYRGNIDQMKLRMAINEGLSRMARRFDDLDWVGVIQVDTLHVHCHLCMVDRGQGRVAGNGKQRGKLYETDKRDLRRGIDDALQLNAPVRMLSSSVALDRRNARCFMKRLVHRMVEERGAAQFLVACLPEDRRLWRAASRRKEMRKPNRILSEIVDEALSLPQSGFSQAMRDIRAYADSRAEREGLTRRERDRLVDDGVARLKRECMDGVYAMLKGIPKPELPVRTPMLHAMSMPFEQAAVRSAGDDLVEFGFRLRSYASRLEHHRKERRRFDDLARAWEESEGVSPESAAWHDFCTFERGYQERCMAKYQHFLSFLPAHDAHADAIGALVEQRRRVEATSDMLNDKSIARMAPEAAEEAGREVYGVSGGRLAVTAPEVLAARLEEMRSTEERMAEKLAFDLSEDGLEERDGEAVPAIAHPFDEVKALDIHHLGWDFPYDAPVSANNARAFADAAEERAALLVGAKAYLEGSGQAGFVEDLPESDVARMLEMARSLVSDGVLPSERVHSGANVERSKTATLDVRLPSLIEAQIRYSVEDAARGLD